MTYEEYKNNNKDATKSIPWEFAFSNEQFREILKKWNLTESKEDLNKIASIGYGGYMLKKDLPKLKILKDLENAEKNLMKNDDEFCYTAFLYELANHEFGYTLDPTETLESLSLTVEEVKNDERLKTLFIKAKREYLASFEG